MEQFTTPVAHFREVLDNLGDRPATFEVGGQSFSIANAFGETDLITCPPGCTIQGGIYDLSKPRELEQGYILLLYQCSYCDHLFMKQYDLRQLKQYPAQEVRLVVKLILDVIIKGTNGKRITLDFFENSIT